MHFSCCLRLTAEKNKREDQVHPSRPLYIADAPKVKATFGRNTCNMKRVWIIIAATFTANCLIAVPFKIADITVDVQGTNTIVTLNNKEYSVAQVTALLKTRTQQIMVADHLSYAEAQRELGDKVSSDLLEAGRPVAYIQINQGP